MKLPCVRLLFVGGMLSEVFRGRSRRSIIYFPLPNPTCVLSIKGNVVEQYESLNLALFLRAMSALSYTVILRVNVVKLPCICFECLNDRWTEEMTTFYMQHSLALLSKVS